VELLASQFHFRTQGRKATNSAQTLWINEKFCFSSTHSTRQLFFVSTAVAKWVWLSNLYFDITPHSVVLNDKILSKPSSIYNMNPSCSSVFLLVVDFATYQWAPLCLWCCLFNTHHRHNTAHRYVLWVLVRHHTLIRRLEAPIQSPLMSSWQDAFPHTYRRLSVNGSLDYFINIRQHNTQRKIHSQEKTEKTKQNTHSQE